MTLRLVLLILASSVLCAETETFSAVAADFVDGEVNRGTPDMTSRTEQRSPPTPADHSPAGNPLWAIPIKVLSATRERPIFSPSRRPPPMIASPLAVPASATASKPSEPERPPLLLVGTVVGEKEAIGVFLDETTKNPIRLRTGDGHQGWVLQSVHGREATFQKDQQTATLSLPQPGIGQSSASPIPVISTSPPPREPRRRDH